MLSVCDTIIIYLENIFREYKEEKEKMRSGKNIENNRITRFKLYKSGKQWIKASLTKIGLLKFIKGFSGEVVSLENKRKYKLQYILNIRLS